MNRKVIIIILALIASICVGVGVIQSNDAKTDGPKVKRESISDTIDSTTPETEITSGIIDTLGSTNESATNNSTSNTTTTNAKNSKNTTNAKNDTTNKERNNSTTTTKKNTTTAQSTEKNEFNVTLTISCKNAVNYGLDVPTYMVYGATYKATEGDTVFDALESICKTNGISLYYEKTSYIKGIGGLKEKDCGGASGWMYRVNGTPPTIPAVGYKLSSGDKIEWYYVTSSTDK